MKKLILILLPAAIFLAACEEPPPPPKKVYHATKAKPENPEFRAVEKPSSYAPEER